MRFLICICVFTTVILQLKAASIATDDEAQASSRPVCPSPDIIAPCTCSDDDAEPLVRCTNIQDVTVFEEVLTKGNGTIHHVMLNSSNLGYIPTDTMSNQTVPMLMLVNSKVEDISQGGPRINGLERLMLLNVSSPNAWTWLKMPDMNLLHVENTTIGDRITADFGESFGELLHTLFVINTNVSLVEPEAFEKQRNLGILQLSHNKLTTLPREALPVPCNLTRLDLDNNRITHIPGNLFSDMPLIQTIDLSNNSLSTLPEEVFKPLWNSNSTVEVDLRGNPIKCDCRILWAVTQPKPRYLQGNCRHPKRLFGRKLSELNPEDLQC